MDNCQLYRDNAEGDGRHLAPAALHGRGAADQPRRPSEKMTGPQTTNASAPPDREVAEPQRSLFRANADPYHFSMLEREKFTPTHRRTVQANRLTVRH